MSIPAPITKFKRPRILVKAARIAMQNQDRAKLVSRVLGCSDLPPASVTVERLRAREEEMNAARLAGDASYDIQRHITVLAALMIEMQRLPH